MERCMCYQNSCFRSTPSNIQSRLGAVSYSSGALISTSLPLQLDKYPGMDYNVYATVEF